MIVKINGDPREVPEGLNVSTLLDFLEMRNDRVAIEHNLDILPRAALERNTSPAERQLRNRPLRRRRLSASLGRIGSHDFAGRVVIAVNAPFRYASIFHDRLPGSRYFPGVLSAACHSRQKFPALFQT